MKGGAGAHLLRHSPMRTGFVLGFQALPYPAPLHPSSTSFFWEELFF